VWCVYGGDYTGLLDTLLAQRVHSSASEREASKVAMPVTDRNEKAGSQLVAPKYFTSSVAQNDPRPGLYLKIICLDSVVFGYGTVVLVHKQTISVVQKPRCHIL
jgi:hypothetical protein